MEGISEAGMLGRKMSGGEMSRGIVMREVYGEGRGRGYMFGERKSTGRVVRESGNCLEGLCGFPCRITSLYV